MDLLNGKVSKLYYSFLIPAVSSAIAVAAYSLVDTIAIGQGVGANGTAACAIVLPIFSIASFIALLCGIGGSVLMSQARGSGNREKGDAYFAAALVYVLLVTVIAWIPGCLFQEAFYRLCGADNILLPYAMEYGRWIFAFQPSFVLTTFLACFIRTDGAPRFVMCCTLTGGAVNMIGDWLFVFPLNMGMAGAAIATVLGSVVQVGMMLGYILLGKTTLRIAKPYNWLKAFRKITIIGFSAGLSSLAVIAVSFIANNQIMKYAGGAALAVYGVLGTVSALFNSIFSGIGQAAQPIVSENYGAGQHDRCWMAAKLGMKNAVLFGLFFTVVNMLFPLQLTGFFMKMTPEVEAIAPYILRVYGISYLPLAVSLFFISYLQSVLKPQMATILSLMRGILLNTVFLFLFPLFLGGNGIWWAISAAEAITMLAAVLYVGDLFRQYRKTE